MGISLPAGDNVNIPDVPMGIKSRDPELYEYLRRMRYVVADAIRGQFNNTFLVATTINAGTSGTFVVSSGGTIVVTSGIVITVTS